MTIRKYYTKLNSKCFQYKNIYEIVSHIIIYYTYLNLLTAVEQGRAHAKINLFIYT